ncbi:type II DNA modification methyltransferase [Camelimonas fluminis]|nr:type II DNA modification methyltransferase [Camelimonas fluminis]
MLKNVDARAFTAAEINEMVAGLIVDSFAGGGGASTGIEWALHRSPDFAINHDAEALCMHEANHPMTMHLPHNIWKVHPASITQGRPVGVLWASPDCRSHSRASGGKPRKQNIRDLAWVVVRWAKTVRPKLILLENVREFAEWGPLTDSGQPCKERLGQTFADWVSKFERLGYRVEYRFLKACDYGSPTIRERLFLVARCDGKPIIWPAPTHGSHDDLRVIAGLIKPHRISADIVDWSIPCPSIFMDREGAHDYKRSTGVIVKRPLETASLARIAKGIRRRIIEAQRPFIITTPAPERRVAVSAARCVPGSRLDMEAADINAAMPKRCPARSETATSAAILRQFGNSVASSIVDPLGTTTCHGGGKSALLTAQMAPARGGFIAQQNTGLHSRDARKPLSTILAKGANQTPVTVDLAPVPTGRLSSPHILNMKGSTQRTRCMEDPMPTQCAGGNHIGAVDATLEECLTSAISTLTPEQHSGAVRVAQFLRQYGCWDGPDIVCVHGYVITDIGLRMLTPRELARGQGFPDKYQLDPVHLGKRLTKTSQTRMIGNSVCPHVAAALAHANVVLASIAKTRPLPYRPWGAAMRDMIKSRRTLLGPENRRRKIDNKQPVKKAA